MVHPSFFEKDIPYATDEQIILTWPRPASCFFLKLKRLCVNAIPYFATVRGGSPRYFIVKVATNIITEEVQMTSTGSYLRWRSMPYRSLLEQLPSTVIFAWHQQALYFSRRGVRSTPALMAGKNYILFVVGLLNRRSRGEQYISLR